MYRYTFRLIVHLLLWSLLLCYATPGNRLFAQEMNEYLPGEVVVKLAQVGDLAGVAATYGLDPTPIDQFGTRPIYRLRILDQSAPPLKAAALVGDVRVRYAEPNYQGQAPEGQQRTSWAAGGGVGEYAIQWAAATIRLVQAHTVTRGAGVVVAVLDTGIDPTHPQVAGRLVGGYDFVDMDANPSEVGAYGVNIGYGHGTHVAGLVTLVAPDARIMPVRILDPEGIGNIWVLSEALAYAVNPDGNPHTDDGADVINFSLSTTRRTMLLDEILNDITCRDGNGDDDDDDVTNCLAFRQHGVVVVAAAGNRASSNPEYPAAERVAGLIAVAASSTNDTLAAFSNYGAWVHVAAPGDQIMSSVPGGGYGVWSGTSMAAPITAGVVALVRAANPRLLPPAVADLIQTSAVAINAPVPKRLDAAAAVALTLSTANKLIPESCSAVLGQITVNNLRVPANTTCTLQGTQVNGTLTVEPNATILASAVQVTGNLQADQAAVVHLVGNSVIGGNIQIKQSRTVYIAQTQIKGNVELLQNTGTITLQQNSVNGNLQCKGNGVAPSGSGNLVNGAKEEQCAGL